MSASSPTQRSLAMLRDAGYTAEVTERWIPGANIRKDLYGFIDILALKGKEILGVQTTSYSNMSARAKKIAEHENTPIVRAAEIRLEVHGWKKVGARWQCKVLDVS